jgi:hypothetical protein
VQRQKDGLRKSATTWGAKVVYIFGLIQKPGR